MNLLETLNFVNQNVLNACAYFWWSWWRKKSVFYYLLSFMSELPDITKKIDILAQKPPVFGDIQTYKYNLVTTGP